MPVRFKLFVKFTVTICVVPWAPAFAVQENVVENGEALALPTGGKNVAPAGELSAPRVRFVARLCDHFFYAID